MKQFWIIVLVCLFWMTACQTNTPATPNSPNNQNTMKVTVPEPAEPTNTPTPEPKATPTPPPTPTRDPLKLSLSVSAHEVANLKGGGPSNGIAWHPESTFFAMSGIDAILIVEIKTLAHAFILEDHTEITIDLAWSPDGNTLASLSLDETILLWPAPNYESPGILEVGLASSMDWSPIGDRLLVGNVEGELQIWDVTTGEMVDNIPSDDQIPILDVDWSPDGSMIAACDGLGTLTIWDAVNLEILQEFQAEGSALATDIDWSPNNDFLAAGYTDGMVIIWETQGWQTFRTLEAVSEGVSAIAWSPDSLILAAGGYGKNVGNWDVASGARLPGGGVDTSVASLAWAPNGNIMAVGAGGRRTRPTGSGLGTGGMDYGSKEYLVEQYDYDPDPDAGLVYLWIRKQ